MNFKQYWLIGSVDEHEPARKMILFFSNSICLQERDLFLAAAERWGSFHARNWHINDFLKHTSAFLVNHRALFSH